MNFTQLPQQHFNPKGKQNRLSRWLKITSAGSLWFIIVVVLSLAQARATFTPVRLVKDIAPNIYGSYPSEIVEADGTLFFRANDATTGSELWKSDGTEAGTVLVKDIVPGADSSSLPI